MWFDIFLIVFFIILNGFFVAAEIAVVTSRRSRIKQLIDQGNKTALLLSGFKEKPARFLATIQIGVTLAVTLASAIGGALSVKLLKPLLERVPVHIISTSSGGLSVAIVAVILTYFTVVFGELIPK
jgi:putative hemolysin